MILHRMKGDIINGVKEIRLAESAIKFLPQEIDDF